MPGHGGTNCELRCACRVWLGAVALIGYTVLFNLLVVVAQTKLNRATSTLMSFASIYQHAFVLLSCQCTKVASVMHQACI